MISFSGPPAPIFGGRIQNFLSHDPEETGSAWLKGMAIHRVSSSSRVWFEFELTFELAHARSILSILQELEELGPAGSEATRVATAKLVSW